MNRIGVRALFAGALVGLGLAGAGRAAEEPLVVPLWPGKAAGDTGIAGEERFRPPENAPTKDAKWLTNVSKPTITVFRPPAEKNSGVAMIICPGGGYWNLAWDLEGEEVAAWLNSVGMTGIVLKYRVPRRAGESEDVPPPGPLLDAQRAVSVVRSRAKEWGIDPSRIGIVGFSAGGHLAVATATQFETRGYPPVDEADRASCRPDFAVAVYPGYFAARETGALAPYMRVVRKTPPVMLVHASDDPVSHVENSLVMYQALKRVGVPTELHVYATGGHGFGVRTSPRPCSSWTARCIAWLRDQGLLKQ